MGIFTFDLFPTDFSPFCYAGTHLWHAPLWLQIDAASKTIQWLHHTNRRKRTFNLNTLIIISLSWSLQTLTCKLLHFLQFLCLSGTLPPHCLRTTSAQPISTPTKKTSLLSSRKSTTVVQLLELWLLTYTFPLLSPFRPIACTEPEKWTDSGLTLCSAPR